VAEREQHRHFLGSSASKGPAAMAQPPLLMPAAHLGEGQAHVRNQETVGRSRNHRAAGLPSGSVPHRFPSTSTSVRPLGRPTASTAVKPGRLFAAAGQLPQQPGDSASASVAGRNGRSGRPGAPPGQRAAGRSPSARGPLPVSRATASALRRRWRRTVAGFLHLQARGLRAHVEVRRSPAAPSRGPWNSRSLPGLPLAITKRPWAWGLDRFSHRASTPLLPLGELLRPGQQPRHPLLAWGLRNTAAACGSVPREAQHQPVASGPAAA